MFTGKKMVKGVIYDNPNIAEEEAYKVASALGVIMDNFDDACEHHDFSKCPNRDEFMTFITLNNIITPCGEGRNMIIPSCMVDNKLRRELSNIDIGDQIIEQFVISREENYDNKVNASEDTKEYESVDVEVGEVNEDNSKELVTVYLNDKPIGKVNKSEAASYIRELFSLAS